MTDRELLELAAKSAGLLIGFSEGFPDPGRPYVWNDDHKTSRWWNPLTDDDDALRLAVKLGVTISIDLHGGETEVWKCETHGVERLEPHSTDPYAATRRAIVRAAAEIGRAMT